MKRSSTPALFLLFFCSVVLAYGQKSEVFKKEEAAIRGYDPVAYFTDGKPVKGNKEFTLSWNGASWYFSSAANRDLFEGNPSKYAPQFGGYCAYGIADGHKAPTQPEAWTVVDDKLYLNYNLDVRTDWLKKQKEYIIQANQNWPGLKNN